MKKRLLCVVPSYWPAFKYGGPIYSVHSLNRALVKKGFDVTVYTTNAGLKGSVAVNKEIEADGIKVTYFSFLEIFKFANANGWQFSWSLTKALRKNLKFFDVVSIVSIWSYPSAVTAYYCRKIKKPYMISPRGTLYSYTMGKKIWKKLPYYNFIAKRDLMKAAKIHYTTKDEEENSHFSLSFRNQAVVVPNGLDLVEFSEVPLKEWFKKRYPVLKDKKIVLFLGRIHKKKGLDILVRAFNLIVKEKTDVHLVIAGNDEERYFENVKRWIKEYDIEDKVSYIGMLRGKEKLEAFAGSDVFVMPSYSENFGIAAVEAMACCLPVVISNKVGIYKEVEMRNAGIVVNTDEKSLYSGIKLLLEDPKIKEEVAFNGRKLVEEYYDINKVADNMAKTFEEIVLKGELL